MNARVAAAQRLQQLGWSLVHYAQAVERAVERGEAYREELAQAQRTKALDKLREFFRARDLFRGKR